MRNPRLDNAPMHQPRDELERARQRIRDLRDAHGIRSVRALALAAGVPQPALSRFLNGKSETMEVPSFMALAAYFGVTISELLGEVPLSSGGQVRELQALAQRMDQPTRSRWLRLGKVLLEDAKDG